MRSEIPFSGGRGGGSVRRAINRLMPSAPAKIGAVALVVLVVAGGWMGGVFQHARSSV